MPIQWQAEPLGRQVKAAVVARAAALFQGMVSLGKLQRLAELAEPVQRERRVVQLLLPLAVPLAAAVVVAAAVEFLRSRELRAAQVVRELRVRQD